MYCEKGCRKREEEKDGDGWLNSIADGPLDSRCPAIPPLAGHHPTEQGILDHSYHSAPQRPCGTLTALDLPLIITLIPALALHRDVDMMKLCELHGRRARLVVPTS